MINFDTNNLIVVAYPPMAGGKFLINCLALSSNAVLQHAGLAQLDLDGALSSVNKMQILRNKIKLVGDRWDDLRMGCDMLFGVNIDRYREYVGDMSIFTFAKVIDTLSNSDKLFFIVAHDTEELSGILKIWPQARVIAFNNCLPFITHRGGRDVCSEYWNVIRGPDWPELAPKTVDDLMQGPPFVIDQVNKDFPLMYDKMVDCIERYPHRFEQTTFWDTNWYFSAEQTATAVKQLYRKFNLDDFNQEYIIEYHTLWINKLNELK